MKKCPRCNLVKEDSDFAIRNRLMRDGVTRKQYLEPKCKKCKAELRREWGSKNPDKVRKHNIGAHKNFLTAKRRALLKNATPCWADMDKIRQLYIEAKSIEDLTGNKHEVDHVIPLQGRTVCGLHVEYNMQVIPAEINRRKSNTLTN